MFAFLEKFRILVNFIVNRAKEVEGRETPGSKATAPDRVSRVTVQDRVSLPKRAADRTIGETKAGKMGTTKTINTERPPTSRTMNRANRDVGTTDPEVTGREMREGKDWEEIEGVEGNVYRGGAIMKSGRG